MLPLPISINKLYVFNKYIHQKVYKKEGREYLETCTILVKNFVKKYDLKPIDQFFYLDMSFWLGSKNADSHNYKKLILDVLQHGGLVTNDKFILDRTQQVQYDKENPRVVLTFEQQRAPLPRDPAP